MLQVRKDTLYIIIPAYNEQDNIRQTIDDWYHVFRQCNVSAESKIVIVNDGSTDKTAQIVRDAAGTYQEIHLMNKKNGGHGSALIEGYKYAIENKADYIFQTDSDGQTNACEFPDFWKRRSAGTVLIGKRMDRGDGSARLFVEKILCLVLFVIFGVKVPDANAPFRLMHYDFLRGCLDVVPSDCLLPNVIITVVAQKSGRAVFKEISFGKRERGRNKMNYMSIAKIAVKAVYNFTGCKSKVRKAVRLLRENGANNKKT